MYTESTVSMSFICLCTKISS